MKPEKRTPIPAVTENIPAMEIKNSDVSIDQLVHVTYIGTLCLYLYNIDLFYKRSIIYYHSF